MIPVGWKIERVAPGVIICTLPNGNVAELHDEDEDEDFPAYDLCDALLREQALQELTDISQDQKGK